MIRPLGAAAVVCLGCGGLLEPRPHRAADGSFEVKAPVWFEPAELNDAAELELATRTTEQYFLVLSEPRSDFVGSLDEYGELTLGRYCATLGSCAQGRQVPRTLDGHAAVETVIEGRMGEVPFTMVHTLVEGEWAWFQVLAWTLHDRFPRNEPELRLLVDSFDELGPPVVDGEVPPVQVFRSTDGDVELELPSDFVPTTAEGELVLRLEQPSAHAYVVLVGVEQPELSLDEAARVTVAQAVAPWADALVEPPERRRVGAGDAVFTVVSGTDGGARVHGVHVMVGGRRGMHQLLMWTVASRWPMYEAPFRLAAESLREVERPDH